MAHAVIRFIGKTESATEVRRAFFNGKDFHIFDIRSGRDTYCSIRDFSEGDSIEIRFGLCNYGVTSFKL